MSDFWSLIIGALLAVCGGVINSEINSLRSCRRERKAICVSISDELTEIAQILNKIKTVWEATHILVPSYVKDLRSCTETYSSLRQRLFLIKDKGLRKDIVTFYRNLKSATNADLRKVGSLSTSEDAQKEQEEIANRFIGFLQNIENLQDKLQ